MFSGLLDVHSRLGRVPHPFDRNGGFGSDPSMGLSARSRSRLSPHALDGEYDLFVHGTNQSGFQAGGIALQASAAGHHPMSFEPDAPPACCGIDIPQAGTSASFEGPGTDSYWRYSSPDVNGNVTVTEGAGQPLYVKVGYAFTGDVLNVFATESTSPMSPLSASSFPKLLASGHAAGNGSVIGVRGNLEELGDFQGVLVERVEVLSQPSGTLYGAGSSMGAGTTTLLTKSESGMVDFRPGGSLTTEFSAQTEDPGGGFADWFRPDSGSWTHVDANGFHLAVPDTMDGAERTFRGVFTEDADFFVGVNDTPGAEENGILFLAQGAVTSSYLERDHFLVGLGIDPGAPGTTTSLTQFTPSAGQELNFTGASLLSQRYCDPSFFKPLPSLTFAATAPTELGPSEVRIPFAGAGGPVLKATYTDGGLGFVQNEFDARTRAQLHLSIGF